MRSVGVRLGANGHASAVVATARSEDVLLVTAVPDHVTNLELIWLINRQTEALRGKEKVNFVDLRP